MASDTNPANGKTAGSRALLPQGLGDILPPDAAREAAAVEALLGSFHTYGYERVKPPLVEFEDGLLEGAGEAMATQTFRIMDPLSHRMMAVRPDFTLQVARIATSRLAGVPRPLRLSYAGEVLRVRGSQMRPNRGFAQVGVELIGAARTAAQVSADVEVVTLAAEALLGLGIKHLSVDLNLPTLVPVLLDEKAVDHGVRPRLRAALNRKDLEAVGRILSGDRETARLVQGLVAAMGPADASIAALGALDLPPNTRADCDRLVEGAQRLLEAGHDFALTIDPVEHRGFEYHTGVSFSIFAQGITGDLGRGGRYEVPGPSAEPATGFTLFMDTVMTAVPRSEETSRLYLPFPEGVALGRRLREEGWITVSGLGPVADPREEARRLGCAHVVIDGRVLAAEG